MTTNALLAETLEAQLLDVLRINGDLLDRLRAWLDGDDEKPFDQLVAGLAAMSEATERTVLAMRLLAGEPTAITEARALCPACALRVSGDDDL